MRREQEGGSSAARYKAQLGAYEAGARMLHEQLARRLQDSDLAVVSVTARAKTVESFERKSEKKQDDGSRKYKDPLVQITDLVAGRVITLLPAMVDQVCAVVRDEFELVEETDKGAETRSQGLFGYASKHFVAQFSARRLREPGLEWFQGRKFEIQVRTVAQHAWAEFEHDTRYKGSVPADRRTELDRRFLLAAALAEKMDDEFTEIDRIYHTSSEERELSSVESGAPLEAGSLRDYLVKRYPTAYWSGPDAYNWMLRLLREQNFSTLEELDQRLRGIESAKVAEAVNVRERAGPVRRLDDDLLLAVGDAWLATSHDDGARANNLDIRRRLLRKAGLWRE